MVVEVVFPGWMPFRRLAVAYDIPGVELQSQYMNDLKAAAARGLKETKGGEGMDPADLSTRGQSSTTISTVWWSPA